MTKQNDCIVEKHFRDFLAEPQYCKQGIIWFVRSPPGSHPSSMTSNSTRKRQLPILPTSMGPSHSPIPSSSRRPSLTLQPDSSPYDPQRPVSPSTSRHSSSRDKPIMQVEGARTRCLTPLPPLWSSHHALPTNSLVSLQQHFSPFLASQRDSESAGRLRCRAKPKNTVHSEYPFHTPTKTWSFVAKELPGGEYWSKRTSGN